MTEPGNYQVGQLVRFISGGPTMAVVDSTDDRALYGYVSGFKVRCNWFTTGGEYRTEVFKPEMLMPADQ